MQRTVFRSCAKHLRVWLTLLATAGAAAGAENILVFNTLSCGEWIQRASYPTGKMANEYWLAGFMSGHAIAAKVNALKDTDLPSMTLWLDKHCRNDPLSNSVVAAKLLFLELTKRKSTMR